MCSSSTSALFAAWFESSFLWGLRLHYKLCWGLQLKLNQSLLNFSLNYMMIHNKPSEILAGKFTETSRKKKKRIALTGINFIIYRNLQFFLLSNVDGHTEGEPWAAVCQGWGTRMPKACRGIPVLQPPGSNNFTKIIKGQRQESNLDFFSSLFFFLTYALHQNRFKCFFTFQSEITPPPLF